MRQIPRLIAGCTLLLALAPAAHAQGPWSAFATGGAVAFSDAAQLTVENVESPTAFSASATTRLTIGVARDLGQFGVRLAYGYAEAGLGSSGAEKVIFVPALTLHEVTLLATYRITGTPLGSMVTVRAGPMFQSWGGTDIDTRNRWGGQAGLTVDAPLVPHLYLIGDLSLGIAGSFLEERDLTLVGASYELKSVRSTEFAVGMRYRF